MPDRESVITHLLIIHTWAEFSREHDLHFITAKHLEDIAQWADDALALLKEQEELGTELTNAMELIHKKNERIEKLLKEQEAVKPKSKVRHGANAQIQHFCGNCNSMLHGKPKYCSECGKGVLW